MTGNCFEGMRTCQKRHRRSSSARSAKINCKTPHTLKHMLNFHRLAIDWYYFYLPNVAEKA